MIREGDTKDANDTGRDDKASQEKRLYGGRPERIPCKDEKHSDLPPDRGSLS